MAIEIQKGVSVAVCRSVKSEERKAMEAMEVGDSFEFTEATKGRVQMAAVNLKSAWRGDRCYAIRGLRVWRTK